MAEPTPLHEDFRRIRPALEGELVRLRAVDEEDLPRLNEMFNDPDVLQFLDVVPFGQPLAGIREWWSSSRGRDDLVNFVIETLPGEPIGVCGLEGIDASSRSCWLGIWIGAAHWERGFGTDAMRTVCRFAFRQMNLQRVSLYVFDTNPRGRAVYEKVGFKHEGTLRRGRFRYGRYVDLHVMGLLAEDLTEP